MGNYHARFYEGLGRGDTPSLLSSGNNSGFTYDGYGHIVEIVETVSGSPTGTSQFVWSAQNAERMDETRDGTGSSISQFFSRGQLTAGNSYFYNIDESPNSVREVSNSTGVVQATLDYAPFGPVTKNGIIAPDFQYAGYYTHGRSGLSLTVHRAYSPRFGRWINRDRLGERGGINLFVYAKNNPISFNDPIGDVCGRSKDPKPNEPEPDPCPGESFSECVKNCEEAERTCKFDCLATYARTGDRLEYLRCLNKCYQDFADCFDCCKNKKY